MGGNFVPEHLYLEGQINLEDTALILEDRSFLAQHSKLSVYQLFSWVISPLAGSGSHVYPSPAVHWHFAAIWIVLMVG